LERLFFSKVADIKLAVPSPGKKEKGPAERELEWGFVPGRPTFLLSNGKKN